MCFIFAFAVSRLHTASIQRTLLAVSSLEEEARQTSSSAVLGCLWPRISGISISLNLLCRAWQPLRRPRRATCSLDPLSLKTTLPELLQFSLQSVFHLRGVSPGERLC